jgi:hypothetical protein
MQILDECTAATAFGQAMPTVEEGNGMQESLEGGQCESIPSGREPGGSVLPQETRPTAHASHSSRKLSIGEGHHPVSISAVSNA